MRSSVVPQTIASETAQKTNWKNHFDSTVASEKPMIGKAFAGSPKSFKKKPSCPMNFPAPKAKAKPTAQYMIAAIEKFTRILATTVPAFLPREKPISRKAKPACMNITRMPAMSTHTELIATSTGSLPAIAESNVPPSASAAAGTANVASNPAPTPVAQRVLRIDPPLSNSIEVEDRGRARPHHCPGVEDSPALVLPAVEHLSDEHRD